MFILFMVFKFVKIYFILEEEELWGRIRVKSRRELGLLTITSIPSLTSSTTVSSSSPSSLGPHGGGCSSSLLTPPTPHTPVMSPLPTSPIPPPGSPVLGPSTNPLAVPLNLSYPLKCHHCNYIGTCESVFLRHLRTHGTGAIGVRLYNCASCPYSATQWESVRRHAWRQHRQEVGSEKENPT
ncbi:hypothetical protein SK128_004435 [Halocaridina rubra]|uniref:C2H2-type domain-containing protein n=1 Tax=Halocaridina rubra TaxID=373956 RepID=A0AAN9A3J8_HALRR